MLAQDMPPRYLDAPTPKELETISISIGLGSQGRSSSIVLPREHDLVKHLERLLPAIAASTAASAASTSASVSVPSPVVHFDRQEASRHTAVNALTSMSTRAPSPVPTQAPIASMSQYIRANSRYETSTLPVSPSYQPSHPTHLPSISAALPSATSSPLFRSAPATSFISAPEPRLAGTRRRRGASGSGKKCQIAGCDKISVSRGLCRGHGGGRRCQHAGCAKGAQSRSDFCWAHGGGQRCEVKGCMRSRKSKRFCVAHLSWENAPLAPSASSTLPPAMELTSVLHQKELAPLAHENHSMLSSGPLPSLRQALRNNSSPVASRQ